MEGAVETLSSNENSITLLEENETSILEFREDALFEGHAEQDEMATMNMGHMILTHGFHQRMQLLG